LVHYQLNNRKFLKAIALPFALLVWLRFVKLIYPINHISVVSRVEFVRFWINFNDITVYSLSSETTWINEFLQLGLTKIQPMQITLHPVAAMTGKRTSPTNDFWADTIS